MKHHPRQKTLWDQPDSIQQAYEAIEEIEPGRSGNVMGRPVARAAGHDIYVDGRGPYSARQAARVVNFQPPGEA